MALRLSCLQCRLDIVISNKPAGDQLICFLPKHCLDSYRFEDWFTRRITTNCQPLTNGFRSNRWINPFNALDLQPDWTIFVLHVVMDSDLTLEFRLVVENVFVVAQREDRLFGL